MADAWRPRSNKPHAKVRTAMSYAETLRTFQQLCPGDRLEVRHDVTVGFRRWHTTTVGTVVKTERRRRSLHFQRNYDDKVYSDIIVLKRQDGELTTVSLDEFSSLRKLTAHEDPRAKRD